MWYCRSTLMLLLLHNPPLVVSLLKALAYRLSKSLMMRLRRTGLVHYLSNSLR